MTNSVLGIVGGSGVYDIEMDNARWERVDSPWGEPSDEVRRGEIGGLPVVFLPRHGRGHRVSPIHINYRANIDALKRCGVTDLISVSACGSFREELAPGDVRHHRPVHRPHLRPREELFRNRPRGPCLGRAPDLPRLGGAA
jgi:5'-methylthioadenosine phosphorylase